MMSGTPAPKSPETDEFDDGHPSSRRQRSSILGLSIVSGLNVACLAFIAYHFTNHPHELQQAPEALPATDEKTDADAPPPATPAVFGNIDLAPASRKVVEIASGFTLVGEERIDRRESGSTTPSELGGTGQTEAAVALDLSSHWVQLGALSKEQTARRYWSSLKQRHEKLLRDREPRIFGPEEVGGGLYHIRLGPMVGEAAASFCEKLETEGVDCFCVSPQEERL